MRLVARCLPDVRLSGTSPGGSTLRALCVLWDGHATRAEMQRCIEMTTTRSSYVRPWIGRMSEAVRTNLCPLSVSYGGVSRRTGLSDEVHTGANPGVYGRADSENTAEAAFAARRRRSRRDDPTNTADRSQCGHARCTSWGTLLRKGSEGAEARVLTPIASGECGCRHRFVTEPNKPAR